MELNKHAQNVGIKLAFVASMSYSYLAANKPTITAPGTTTHTCSDTGNLKQVVFSDPDGSDTPTITIVNNAAPNDIFSIDANSGMLYFLSLTILIPWKV